MIDSARIHIESNDPTLLWAADRDTEVIIQSPTQIFLGGPSVSDTTGFVYTNATANLRVGLSQGDALYAMTPSSNPDFYVTLLVHSR